MSAPELLSFLTLSEREFSCGTASAAGNKLTISSFQAVNGKEFDDASGELKDAAKSASRLLVQASMPFGLVSPGPVPVMLEGAAKFGIEKDDLRLAAVPALGAGKVACFSRKAVEQRMAQARFAGNAQVQLFCRGINVVSALKDALGSGGIDKPVLYMDIQQGQTQLFVVSAASLASAGSIPTGTDSVLEQVMAALNLKFPSSAAKLFYGDLIDFEEHSPKLVAQLAQEASAKLASAGCEKPAYVIASGFPSSRSVLLSSRLADALKLATLPYKAQFESQGASVPAYMTESFLGLSRLLSSPSSLCDLSAADADLASLSAAAPAEVAKPATPAPAPAAKAPAPAAPAAPAPKAPVKEEPKPVAKEAPKPATPAKEEPKTAAKPAPVEAKPTAPAKEAPKPAAKPEPAKKPEPQKAPAPAAKPSAASIAPEPPPAKAAPAPKPATPKPAVPAKPAAQGKGGKMILVGGIAAAVVIIAVVGIILSGGKDKPAPAPVVEVPAPAPEPEPLPAPEPVAPVEEIVQEEPAAPEEPPPPLVGSVSIQSTPIDAEVYINGELKGRTPAIVYDLPEGICEVTIRKASYEDYSATVEVIGGQTQELKGIVLNMLMGSVSVGSSPEGVPYVVTPIGPETGAENVAALRGVTPAELGALKPGSYLVSYERPGWKKYEQKVEVRPGQRSQTSFEYLPGTITITSTPAGASVISAGNVLGVTPLVLDYLPEGNFKATVQLDSYEPESISLDIPFGGSASKEFTLLSLDRLIKKATDLDELPINPAGMTISVPQGLISLDPGKVFIRFIISAEGKVENASIIAGRTLSDAAVAHILAEARKWTFIPGKRKGFPMKVEVVMPVEIAR